MGEMTLLDILRNYIGSIGFKIFLWSIKMTQDEYINSLIEIEQNINNSKELKG